MSLPDNTHAGPAELTADAAEAASVGLRVLEVALIGFAGLLICPPLFVMLVAVVVPTAAVLAVVGAIVGIFAAPILLVRRVRAHHREHGRTVFLHRLLP
jgi:hypothetical protein